MRWLQAIFPLLMTTGLVWALSGGIPDMPQLGMLASPFHGFWQQAETSEPVSDIEEMRLPALQQGVQVVYDDRLVPHIFAQNDHDLYYVQGYLTARFRLWQMEIQTRMAAGRLSEVLGERTLAVDRKYRRMGMEWAASRSLDQMMQNPTTQRALEAYAAGVNAWIEDLSPKDYPLMYKILGHSPRAWEPLHTALLLKLMSWDLTGSSDDLALTNIRAKYGEAVAEELFPDFSPYQEPVYPDFVPPSARKRKIYPMPQPTQPLPQPLEEVSPPAANGSNNWAVAASRSATGFPLLASDPHLTVRLPSVWMQVQLHSPDVNVVGVSLPGAPGVIIGHNASLAWGVTNLAADVLDWYQIRYTANQNAYHWGNETRPISLRTEEIFVKGQEEPVVERVRYAHQGPIVFEQGDSTAPADIPTGYAMRWAGHDGGNELFAFLSINRAKSLASFEAALEDYHCPGQNFVCADTSGQVGLWAAARLPRKEKGQGKYLLDGSRPEDDWQGYLPREEMPRMVAPERGWVASANQHTVPADFPHYLGWRFASWERASRIHARLESLQSATTRDMRQLQLDNRNVLAEKLLPHLLERLRPALFKQDKTRKSVQRALDVLDAWDFQMEVNSLGASYFEAWWANLTDSLWQPHFGMPGMRYPDRAVTTQLLLAQDTSRWYTRQGQPAPLKELLVASFMAACDTVSAAPAAQQAWGLFKGTVLAHLAGIDAFGVQGMPTSGSRHSVNAMGTTHGPSWRMVVEVGPRVRGFGILPGGQSENPGSGHYIHSLDDWRNGLLRELHLLDSPKDLSEENRLAKEQYTRQR